MTPQALQASPDPNAQLSALQTPQNQTTQPIQLPSCTVEPSTESAGPPRPAEIHIPSALPSPKESVTQGRPELAPQQTPMNVPTEDLRTGDATAADAITNDEKTSNEAGDKVAAAVETTVESTTATDAKPTETPSADAKDGRSLERQNATSGTNYPDPAQHRERRGSHFQARSGHTDTPSRHRSQGGTTPSGGTRMGVTMNMPGGDNLGAGGRRGSNAQLPTHLPQPPEHLRSPANISAAVHFQMNHSNIFYVFIKIEI